MHNRPQNPGRFTGSLIEEHEDNKIPWPEEMYNLKEQKNKFVTGSGVYVATNVLGFYKITRFNNDGGSDIVYRISIRDYVYGLIMIITLIGFVVALLVFQGFIKLRIQAYREVKNAKL